MEFNKLYKKPSIFGVTGIKQKLKSELKERRKKRRTQDFEENRKKSSTSQDDNYRKKLLEWKQKQERKKKATKLEQKPPFKVGIVHHHIYSPAVNTRISAVATKGRDVQAKSIVKKSITKATEKRLLAKAADATRKAIILSSNSNTVDSKSLTTCDTNEHGDAGERRSFAPIDHKFKPPAGLLEIPLLITMSTEDNQSRENDVIACDRSVNCIDVHVRRLFRSSSIETIALRMSSDGREASDCSREERLINRPTERHSATSSNGNVKSPSWKIFSSPSSTDMMKREDCAEDLSPFLARARSNVGGDKPDNRSVEGAAKGNLISLHGKFSEGCTIDKGSGLIRSDRFDAPLTITNQRHNEANPGQVSLSEESPSEDTVTRTLDVLSENDKCTVLEYFKRLLDAERKRLQSFCAEWTTIRSRDDIAEDIQCRIDQTIGQTTLLIKEKFQQFRDLIAQLDHKEEDRTEQSITCTDLHGFWDMIYIEVEDCLSRFASLERLRAAQGEQPSVAKPSARSVSEIRAINKERVKSTVPADRSALRTIISAERKKILNIQDHRKISWRDRNTNSECITPFRSVEEITAMKYLTPSDKEFFEGCPIGIHTSTPAVRDIGSTCVDRLSIPLITMKVNQLYGKSAMRSNDNTTPSCVNPDQTPTRNVSERLRKPRRQNVRERSARISSDNADGSNVELNSNENDCTKSNLTDQITIKSVETVIEITLRPEKENDTL